MWTREFNQIRIFQVFDRKIIFSFFALVFQWREITSTITTTRPQHWIERLIELMRNIYSAQKGLAQFVLMTVSPRVHQSVTISLSLSVSYSHGLSHSVSVSIFEAICLSHSVSVNLSLSVYLFQHVSVRLFLSLFPCQSVPSAQSLPVFRFLLLGLLLQWLFSVFFKLSTKKLPYGYNGFRQ